MPLSWDRDSTQGWGHIRTRRDPIFEGTNTNDMKGDGRSARSIEGFVDVHRVDHNYEGPND
jgi:hypothetical protein